MLLLEKSEFGHFQHQGLLRMSGRLPDGTIKLTSRPILSSLLDGNDGVNLVRILSKTRLDCFHVTAILG